MMLALAELELDRILENWAIARDRAIERGVHISRVPPVGYLRRDDGRLEPDPVAAPLIRELFHRRAAGASWRELCEFLDERLPREQGNWTHQTVGSIIRRRTYLGEAYQGTTVNKHAHDPIVSRSEWEAAQSRVAAPRHGKNGALLSGILRCAGCGYALSPGSDGKRGYAYYRCRTRHSAGLCPAPARISVARADPYVETAFLAWAENEQIAAQANPAQEALEQAFTNVELAEEELVAYRDANLVSVIGQEAYVAGLVERQRSLEQARLKLTEARRQVPSLDLHQLPTLWPTLTVGERRMLLGAAIDAVFVRQANVRGKAAYDDRLHVLWRGEAPVDLPGRRHMQLRPFVFPNERPEVVGVADAQDR
jgi:site-specific DNA recombinase